MARKYDSDSLKQIVESSFSIAEVIRKLGLSPSGGNHGHIKSLILRFDIDCSHFKDGSHKIRDLAIKNKRSPSDILVVNNRGKREETKLLRRALIESGIEHKCAKCGLADTWNDEPITLEIDHINGDWLDNRIDNLRFLCPNCHSQRDNCQKNRKYDKKLCADCNLPVKTRNAGRCRSCSSKQNSKCKINWPSHTELQVMVNEIGFVGTGKKLGVSDNAVRKKLKNGLACS